MNQETELEFRARNGARYAFIRVRSGYKAGLGLGPIVKTGKALRLLGDLRGYDRERATRLLRSEGNNDLDLQKAYKYPANPFRLIELSPKPQPVPRPLTPKPEPRQRPRPRYTLDASLVDENGVIITDIPFQLRLFSELVFDSCEGRIQVEGIHKAASFLLYLPEHDPSILVKRNPAADTDKKTRIEVLCAFVRLPLDPTQPAFRDLSFRLFSSDGSYEQIRTSKEDRIEGDEHVDLRFTATPSDKRYTLEVKSPRLKRPKLVFQNEPHAQLRRGGVV